jgi:hypothetical protein
VLSAIQCRTFSLPVCYPKYKVFKAHRNIILREERMLRVLENMVLRRYLGLRGMRKQWNGENYIMRSFMICTHHQNIIFIIKSRRMRWAEYVACMEEMRGMYRILVGKPEGKG